MEQKQTYVAVLITTLEKKVSLLDDLINLTSLQERLIKEEKVDSPDFEGVMLDKDEMIDQLNKADEGFEIIYGRVKEELAVNGKRYNNEISRLKVLISEITQKSVFLQASEKRNQNAISGYFAKQRKGIKDFHVNTKSSANYYKSMMGYQQGQSYYMDKKK